MDHVIAGQTLLLIIFFTIGIYQNTARNVPALLDSEWNPSGMPTFSLTFRSLYRTPSSRIRSHLDIMGVFVRDQEFKLSLFADDVLLTLTRPHVTLHLAQSP